MCTQAGKAREQRASATSPSSPAAPDNTESPHHSDYNNGPHKKGVRSAAEREGGGNIMATLGPESARPLGTQLGSSPSIQSHIGGASLPPNRGLERALEEAVANGVLNLSSRKLKDFPRTASNHDLTDTVDAGMFFPQAVLVGVGTHWASR